MSNLCITDVRVQPGDAAFLLDDGETAILYDTGFGFTGFAVADKVKALLGTRPLDYIFLTHSHYDHALGSAYIKKRYPNAVVVAGEYAAKIFQKPTAKAVMRELDQKFAKSCGVFSYEDLADELQVDLPVSDGSKICAGKMTFEVVNLPGHTKCSVGYYCAEHQLLLGSETIGVFNGADDVVPSYLVGVQLALDSIARVKELDIQQILVPHYGILNHEETALYLKRAEERAKSVAEAIANQLQEGKTIETILAWFKDEFYHGYIKTIYPIDAMELNTHIMIELVKKELLQK
ncbi:MAG: MBL fold metallo-hydrolase [Clostridia bacterium]|nr:MBL fold metallo-hydrolase [Clostridia bacterium]